MKNRSSLSARVGSGSLRPRLLSMFALWLVLVAAGLLLAVRFSGVPARELGGLLALPGPTVLLLGALFLGLYATDIGRYRVLGEAVGAPMGIRTALDASIANYFFGWLTPGGAFGAPAAVVVLARRGLALDAAAVIAFAKSITGVAFILLLAFAALAAGIGPAFGPEIRWTLATGSGVVTVLLAIPIVGGLFPRRSLALIERLETRLGRLGSARPLLGTTRFLRGSVERLAQLRAGGVAMLGKLAIFHLAFYIAFIGVAVVLAMSLGAGSWLRATGVSTVFLAFSYVAPTPGGAGLSEASAVVFYGSLMPPPEAVAVVLLSRALTFYLQVLVGAVYLPIAGGIGEIIAYLERSRGGAS